MYVYVYGVLCVQELGQDVKATGFYLAHQGLNDRRVQEQLYRLYEALAPDLRYIAPHLLLPPSPAAVPGRVLRVGFLSSHLMDHSVGRILFDSVYFLSTQQAGAAQGAGVEVYVFQLNARGSGDADGMSEPRDVVIESLQRLLGDRFVHIHIRHGEDAGVVRDIRAAVGSYSLDALVYPDIGMDFLPLLLSFSRLATLQVRPA